MRALVTGAGGFVGGHLLRQLREGDPALALFGTLYAASERNDAFETLRCEALQVDLTQPDAAGGLVAQVRPDRIFHLAGQAYVPRSFEAPWETLETNIRGTLNLLEAVRRLGLDTRLLVVGSADVYGAGPGGDRALDESTPFVPSSPYSVSKIAQDMLAWQYTRAHGVFTVRMRPFNHIGPGQQTRYAISDWASQIVEAEAGKREPVVHVGNLSAARDFSDVRDVVRAYVLAIERGKPGDVFNVCSGRAETMQWILEYMVRRSRVPVEIKVDPARFRPVDIPRLLGDYSALAARTGWRPEIPLERSLDDVLNEWRARVQGAPTGDA
ncbi:MAG: GDP-mannose 4,6-dehydratase [Anaerolineae bacterium]|nr:GDP-mannose 4,6-dehydratase [Anaerolineae bacterium]